MWKIREANKDDIPFIYATWLNSFRSDSGWVSKDTRRTIYYETYTKVLDKILQKSETLVAVKEDDPFVIFGYIVCEPRILHYLYVKDAFRRMGIAKSLLGMNHVKQFTHKTKYSSYLIKPDWDYNPFLISI